MSSAKRCQKVRAKEAKARRKIAKRWDKITQSVSYQKASTRECCRCETSKLKDELFDGILINLREKNSKKSYNRQKRLLRRIVEKRQAQKVHHIVGKTENRFSNYMFRRCLSKSMKQMSANYSSVFSSLYKSTGPKCQYLVLSVDNFLYSFE